jgi:hypothetical protein
MRLLTAHQIPDKTTRLGEYEMLTVKKEEKKGNRSAEYLRVSIALKQLKKLGLALIEKEPGLSSLVNEAIDYLIERQVKLGNH